MNGYTLVDAKNEQVYRLIDFDQLLDNLQHIVNCPETRGDRIDEIVVVPGDCTGKAYVGAVGIYNLLREKSSRMLNIINAIKDLDEIPF